jgi:PhzF family phenazine biosynthesis protein
MRSFRQVDVFTSGPFSGNPVAVVFDADDLTTQEMARFAHWTNLSETTFVLAPRSPDADYRVRIFTPTLELPFAGHPTLGTCHAWLEHSGVGSDRDLFVQECDAGLIEVRRDGDRLAFAAPSLVRSGPVAADDLDEIVASLGITLDDVVDSAWIDNGPGWVGLLLRSADDVLAVRPTYSRFDIGIVGFHEPGAQATIELRAFFPKDGSVVEDPVTGSLNASVAQWLIDSGRIEAPYMAAQGTALGRAGVIGISQSDDGRLWVAGACATRIEGTVSLD